MPEPVGKSFSEILNALYRTGILGGLHELQNVSQKQVNFFTPKKDLISHPGWPKRSWSQGGNVSNNLRGDKMFLFQTGVQTNDLLRARGCGSSTKDPVDLLINCAEHEGGDTPLDEEV